MAIRKALASEDKLAALRTGDLAHPWASLDDRCSCTLCERTFSGRQVDISVSRLGRVRLACPSEGCPSTPNEWVQPGKPRAAKKPWRAWERILGTEIKNPVQALRLRSGMP